MKKRKTKNKEKEHEYTIIARDLDEKEEDRRKSDTFYQQRFIYNAY